MELVGLVGVMMLSVAVSLASARGMLGAGLFLMTQGAPRCADTILHERTAG